MAMNIFHIYVFYYSNNFEIIVNSISRSICYEKKNKRLESKLFILER